MHAYRDGLKGGPVLLSRSQAGTHRNSTQLRAHFLVHLCIDIIPPPTYPRSPPSQSVSQSVTRMLFHILPYTTCENRRHSYFHRSILCSHCCRMGPRFDLSSQQKFQQIMKILCLSFTKINQRKKSTEGPTLLIFGF